MALSSTQVAELENKALSLRATVTRMKQRAEANMEKVVGEIEVGTAAFTLGAIDGRTGGFSLLGMPLPLLSAIGFHGIGFLGIASSHMHSFGTGSLANYLTTLGHGLGAKMAADAQRAR